MWNKVVKHTTVDFTSDELSLKGAKNNIVIPTSVKENPTPDLIPIQLNQQVERLVKGFNVVYESTVDTCVTKVICIPILERESGLKCGIDFKVGYSPGRINTVDQEHRQSKSQMLFQVRI